MLFKKLSQAIFLSITIAGLAACSTTGTSESKSGSEGSDLGMGGGDTGAVVASGAGDDVTTFSGPGVGDDDKALMRVGNQHYYFEFNKSDVKEKYLLSIKVQADYLIAHPKVKVRLEGNTDERGSREYNIGLGERRAQAVAKTLALDGVGKNQIITVSYGAEKPVATGHDESSYAKNRRVDLVYKK